jgi:hypothetical protein
LKSNATIEGYVAVELTDERLHGALITIEHIDTGKIYKTVSDPDGAFECNVPFGNLYVEISHNGYITVSEYCYASVEKPRVAAYCAIQMQKVTPDERGAKEKLLLGQSTDEKPNTKSNKKRKDQVITRDFLVKRIKETIAAVSGFVVGLVGIFTALNRFHDWLIWTFCFLCFAFLLTLYLIWQRVLSIKGRRIMLSICGFLVLLVLVVCLLWQVHVLIQRSEQRLIQQMEQRITKE